MKLPINRKFIPVTATMVVAFWLQFGTKFFGATPSPTILWWLGLGTIVAAVLTVVAMRARRRPEFMVKSPSE